MRNRSTILHRTNLFPKPTSSYGLAYLFKLISTRDIRQTTNITRTVIHGHHVKTIKVWFITDNEKVKKIQVFLQEKWSLTRQPDRWFIVVERYAPGVLVDMIVIMKVLPYEMIGLAFWRGNAFISICWNVMCYLIKPLSRNRVSSYEILNMPLRADYKFAESWPW